MGAPGPGNAVAPQERIIWSQPTWLIATSEEARVASDHFRVE